MNNFILVGKYLDNPTPKIIRIQIERLLENGEKEYHVLAIELFETSTNIFEYIKEGDTLGIKGRIESLEPTHTPQLIAERLSFLSSKQQEETREKMGDGEI